MPRNLSDEDCELIAQKFIEALSRRLATPPPAAPAEPPRPSLVDEFAHATTAAAHKMAYTGKEVAEMLGVSTTTLWRLRITGRIRAVEGMRRVLFSSYEVERFLRSASQRVVKTRG